MAKLLQLKGYGWVVPTQIKKYNRGDSKQKTDLYW
jgi:hypothetical protein